MKDAQKPDHVSLETLLGRLRDGRFVIPDFQRDFEWTPVDIQNLIRSLFLDYYIGSLLLWRAKPENLDSLSCEPVYGYDAQGGSSPEHIVLDGQQRLTALHYALCAPDVNLPKKANRYLYFVDVDRFMAEEFDAAFGYDYRVAGRRLLNDEQAQFENHKFPLAVIGAGGWALPNWVQGYEKYWSDAASAAAAAGDASATSMCRGYVENAREFGEHLRDLTGQYQIAYIELDKDLALDKVCDIFTQINSRGVKLDVFDLINALLKPQGLQLKHMWREALPRLDFVSSDRLNIYVLQVMSLLRQAYCSPKYLYYLIPGQKRRVRTADGMQHEMLVEDAADFRQRWDQAVEALERSIGMIQHPQEFGAISSGYVPYNSILPVFSALQVECRQLVAAQQLEAQRKIRRWYWASVFTSRYSGSSESTAARDYLDVKAWMQDGPEPAVIAEFGRSFRDLDLRAQVQRGTSVYNGVFNLLVLGEARDWMTGAVPQHHDLDDHHIVPKAWARDRKLETSIDSILNRTPLTAFTNRHVISDRLPNEYLRELIGTSGEAHVRATLESHFVSPRAFDILLRDPFEPEDYEQFIAERQIAVMGAIQDLLVKERLDLAPRLRELDEELERIELALRHFIVQALMLPRSDGHVWLWDSQATAAA